MHLVDQLLVPTAGNTLAVSLAAAAAAARVAKCVQAALHNRAVEYSQSHCIYLEYLVILHL